jgi:hypothetical protein
MKLLYSVFIITAVIFTANIQAKSLKMSLAECATVHNDISRLKCFDLLAKSARTEIKPNEKTVILKKEKNTKKQIDDFGANHLENHESNKVEPIILTVANVKKDAYKRLILTFKNGQVWKQTNDRYFKIKPGEQARLVEGALGSIHLNKLGAARSIKVRRIK